MIRRPGRFLAEDSFTGNNNDPLSLNLYAYCQNDPVNGIDPSGNIMLSVEAAKNQKAGIEVGNSASLGERFKYCEFSLGFHNGR